ncbi:hypothetical protein [Enterococcus durans]|uniref:hypothetical protein n=1 Tax=Enterococcus durans TaxID=53345 RepID=UPI001106D041|nr:hypothetical protein [Enterococcus durans]MBC9703493.1 hypothetical protein [Enterococcus sp.]MBE8847282.1 hypothetical protein [Enterococcus durans]MDB1651945.1 hypothetical protein [Enterococcus durans]MDB1656070.1 hypothetical protein [Enterococcus durans]MDB1662592.1 hypothetical protein [Enterococcus durans]
MLEALEKIKEAEQKNQQSLVKLNEELNNYSESKEKELAAIEEKHGQQLAQLIEEKISLEEKQTAEQKEQLKATEKELQERLLEQYQTHQEQAIAAIIERVIQTYGRH